jgi:malic enzyme
MSFITSTLTAAATVAAAVGIAIAGGPTAAASPDDCQITDATTVCQGTGTADVATNPGLQNQGVDETQNGPYGPAGSTPPVGN